MSFVWIPVHFAFLRSRRQCFLMRYDHWNIGLHAPSCLSAFLLYWTSLDKYVNFLTAYWILINREFTNFLKFAPFQLITFVAEQCNYCVWHSGKLCRCFVEPAFYCFDIMYWNIYTGLDLPLGHIGCGLGCHGRWSGTKPTCMCLLLGAMFGGQSE